ncbi:nucleotide pyrophosphohydrolase [Streptomyces sp. NPDC013012]|uniref:nucleotide pyrophosphohydrolase n=1 Tax=Streptomyces sp. NPDC013012 TaxID=3364860 RepID=UPI0036AC8F10
MAGLRRRLVEFAAARDWQPYHTPKNLAAALSVEAAELLEIFQWLTPEQAERVMEDPESAHRVADEVADVLAYLLQFCEALGIDPLAALAAKIDRNELRFPAKQRGGEGDGRDREDGSRDGEDERRGGEGERRGGEGEKEETGGERGEGAG